MQIPLWQWSALSLAQAIREKEVSSLEVIQAHVDRIQAINHAVNAVTVVLEEDALSAARKADKRIASGKTVGPLHGVPFSLKENIDLAGSATTHGVVHLKDTLPENDAPVVSHLKQAGAIPIARTNLPDYGLRYHTHSDLRGTTLNPWDPSRTPGGSSGGEAAAIATGMSPLGVGNDMGGSIRFPAQCCGIAGMRPSLGRVSRVATSIFGHSPMLYEQIAAANGPMARHVKDLRLALTVMSQPDPGDPWWTPAPLSGPAKPRPIRIAWTTDPTGHGGSLAVAKGVAAAAAILADAGYELEEVDPPSVADSSRAVEHIADMEMKSYLDQMLPQVSAEAKVFLENLMLVGATEPELLTYMEAIGERHRIAREWNLFMERYCLVLGPVSTLLPFKVGFDIAGPGQLKRFIRSLGLTEACNLLGLPSVAIPVQVIDGLPQAVQLIGPRFREDLCFDAAEIIEQRQGVFTPIEPPDADPTA